MFPGAYAALVASPGVRRHGIKSTFQAMPGRRNSVFRTPRVANAPAALPDVQYVDSAPINEDVARLKRMGSRFSECFMTAPSPGIVATTIPNQHYDSHEA